MTTLREAAQQALEALEGVVSAHAYESGTPVEAITALRAALAEPVQEPVAKVELMMTGGSAGLATRIVEIDDHLRERLRPGQLLYTPPPQRKPLSEDEIEDLYFDGFSISKLKEFARAIERAHGIGEKDE
jgi:hypothetical protein